MLKFGANLKLWGRRLVCDYGLVIAVIMTSVFICLIGLWIARD
jgi:hypothetical protein